MILFIIINFLLMILISIKCGSYNFSKNHKNFYFYNNMFKNIITIYSLYSLILIVFIFIINKERYLKFMDFNFLLIFKVIELPFLIAYIIVGKIFYKRYKNHNYINKKWKESKSDIINRLNLYKYVKLIESEKRELIKLNNSIIFKYFPFFKRKYNCKNIQQVCLILNLQYGEYERSWKVQDIQINENLIFKILLNNKKRINIFFEKVGD